MPRPKNERFPPKTPQQEDLERELDDRALGREDKAELIDDGPLIDGYSVWDCDVNPKARAAWRAFFRGMRN